MESHVQLILWIGSASVEIDDISDICSASINEPVMSVKWGSVSIRQHIALKRAARLTLTQS